MGRQGFSAAVGGVDLDGFELQRRVELAGTIAHTKIDKRSTPHVQMIDGSKQKSGHRSTVVGAVAVGVVKSDTNFVT